MRFNWKFGPRDLDDLNESQWYPAYAVLPTRVENKILFLEYYFMRYVPVRDYNSYISKHSENQWTYKWDPEYRLPENMSEEDLANVWHS